MNEVSDYLIQRFYKNSVHSESDLELYQGSLYHYTSASGLLGILQSQKVWGTESTYLNDSLEIKYGLTLAAEVLDEYLKSSDDINQAVINRTKIRLKYLSDEIYIACFSEKGDMLSQWKGYGNYGSGFSIEFTASEFFKKKRKFPYANISFKKVVYETEQQREILKNEIDYVLKYVHDKLDMNDDDFVNDLVNCAAFSIAYFIKLCAYRFKHPSFSEESEWRAILVNASWDIDAEAAVAVKFRTAGEEIIPYVDLDIAPSAQKENWSLPISKIIVGSKQKLVRATKSIELIYRNLNLEKPEVVESEIPLQ